MRRLRGFLLAVGAAFLLAACISLGPTPPPTVTVHVDSWISNVVMAGSLFSDDPVSGEPLVIAPCGEVTLEAPIGNAGGGALGLFIDPSGNLETIYAENPDSLRGPHLSDLSIIWSDGRLRDEDWVTITPRDVTVSDTERGSPIAICEPWGHPVE